MKSNILMAIVVCVLIVGIGWVTFNSILSSVSGPTTSQQMNATMATGNTVFGITGIALVAGAACLILGFLFFWVSTPERFKKPNKYIKFLSDSLYYFGFGCLGLSIIEVHSYLIYFMYNYIIVENNTGAFIDVAKWIPVVIIVFFAIAGFGYVFKKKFVDKLMRRLDEKEYESNLEELPKVN